MQSHVQIAWRARLRAIGEPEAAVEGERRGVLLVDVELHAGAAVRACTFARCLDEGATQSCTPRRAFDEDVLDEAVAAVAPDPVAKPKLADRLRRLVLGRSGKEILGVLV